MNRFLQKHAARVTGVLTGFDRLVLRGTLRQLAYVKGMRGHLSRAGVLLKDFGQYAAEATKRLRAASEGVAKAAARPVQYLRSSQVRKEEVAREIAERDGITAGLICLLECVEPCQSYEIYRDRQAKRLRLEPRRRKCLHIYHYAIHPVFGFMSARIQTWFPFNVQVCVNGREWLARQLDADGVPYTRAGNCFPWVEDAERAQELLDQQIRSDWPALLEPIVRCLNPAHESLFARTPQDYYWSVYQSEVATDVLFKDEEALQRLYPSLVLHALCAFGSPDVLRFLGHNGRIRRDGEVHRRFRGEVTTSYRHRVEGVRVKHWVNGNSVKMYDKAGSVLRVETTINEPRDFKVYRPSQDEPDGKPSWKPMRKGVADIRRRAEVSCASNGRYLDALSAADERTPVGELVEPITRHVVQKGKRYRALRPWAADDAALLKAINQGEFAINGFRNRDLRRLLYTSEAKGAEERRRSAAVSRKLRLLRAHGLIRKVTKTHRYQVTEKGRLTIAALLAAREANASHLAKAA